MLVDGYNDMKPFLPALNMKGTPFVFDDALKVAQAELVSEILGDALEDRLETRDPDDQKLLTLCQRAISFSAFAKTIPDLDLVLSDAGFAVVNNEKMTMASRERVEALRRSTEMKLDDAKDALVNYLLGTTAYDDWRNTCQFADLAGSLMLSFRIFKSAAVYSAATADAFPHSWTEFHDLLPAMNTALLTEAAPYISEDYALELVKKLCTRTVLSAAEKKVLDALRTAVAFSATGDPENARNLIIKVHAFMKSNIDKFPTFAASDEAREVMISHEDTPVFSLF